MGEDVLGAVDVVVAWVIYYSTSRVFLFVNPWIFVVLLFVLEYRLMLLIQELGSGLLFLLWFRNFITSRDKSSVHLVVARLET